MQINGKSDVREAIVKHIEEIDRVINSAYSSGGDEEVRAELLAAKSEALKALAMLYKDRV